MTGGLVAVARRARTPPSAAATQAWVEHVAEGVAEHIEAEDGEGDGQAGPDAEQRLPRDERSTDAAEHAAPGRHRWRDAEAEEAQRRFGEDRRTELHGGEDQQRREDVRQDVAQEDAAVGGADSDPRFRLPLLLD